MEEDPLALQDYIDVALSRWWLLLLGPILAGVIAVGFSLRAALLDPTPYMYEATTLVLMEGAEDLARFPGLVKAGPVLEDAIDDLDLTLSLDTLREKVSASSVGDTPLVQIKVQDPDPTQAVNIANAVAQSLVDYVEDIVGPQLPATEGELSGPRFSPGPGAPDGTGSEGAYALTFPLQRPSIVVPAEVMENSSDAGPISVVGGLVVRNLIIGIFLGSVVAVVVVLALEYLQNPIRSPDQLERRFGLTRLGLLPLWSQLSNQPHRLAATSELDPAAVEAIREVAANVAFVSEAQDTRVVAITSPDSGDGRSSLVANLGVALSSTWKDVVLVDADLRKPALHHYFGLGDCLGVSDFVANAELEAGDIVQGTSYPRLKVITSGTMSSDPAGLLSSPRMKWLLKHLEETAHIVLIDTPPARATVDAVILAAQAQGVVLLVNGEISRLETMKGILSSLQKTNTPLVGYVWNRISPRRFKGYSSRRRYFKSLKQSPGEAPSNPEASPGPSGITSQTNGVGSGRVNR